MTEKKMRIKNVEKNESSESNESVQPNPNYKGESSRANLDLDQIQPAQNASTGQNYHFDNQGQVQLLIENLPTAPYPPFAQPGLQNQAHIQGTLNGMNNVQRLGPPST